VAESPDSPMARRGDYIDDEADLHQMQRARGHEMPAKQKELTWYEWLLKPRPPPPLPWERCREDMIRKWISDKRKYAIVRGLFSGALSCSLSFKLFQNCGGMLCSPPNECDANARACHIAQRLRCTR